MKKMTRENYGQRFVQTVNEYINDPQNYVIPEKEGKQMEKDVNKRKELTKQRNLGLGAN